MNTILTLINLRFETARIQRVEYKAIYLLF